MLFLQLEELLLRLQDFLLFDVLAFLLGFLDDLCGLSLQNTVQEDIGNASSNDESGQCAEI